MRKSIFKQYFTVMSAVILVSLFSLGAVLLLISSKQTVNNKNFTIIEEYKGLYRYVNSHLYLCEDYNDVAKCIDSYQRNISGNVIFADKFGKVLYPSTGEENKYIDTSALSYEGYPPSYFYNDLNGYLKKKYHIASDAIMFSGEKYYLVFVKSDINDWTFVESIMKFYGFSVLIVLIFTSIVTYLVVKNTVRPLVELCDVSKKYSHGDFTPRINIDENNEIGQLAKALNEMAASIEQSELVGKNFIANVSHELRTPMTTISGFVDGILDGTISKDQQEKYLRIVSEETHRLSTVVGLMLSMAKLDSGEVKLSYKEFNIVDMVANCLITFEKQIEEKSIEIAGLGNANVLVYADYDFLYQAVYNLVQNAIKFVNKNGFIEFTIITENDNLVFSIKNSGQGICKDDLPLIFDRFYKSDKSRSLDKTGVGLGLYIASSIINLHNGDISVDSIEGVYTEFAFTIPLNKPVEKGKKK